MPDIVKSILKCHDPSFALPRIPRTISYNMKKNNSFS